MPARTVLLADDHAIVAEGLEALLKDKYKLLGIVHNGRELVAAANQLKPDIIVTDISMPLLNGLDAVRQIKKARPETKVIILTVHAETEMAVEAFRAGAAGYLLKVSAGEELVRAIEEVARGRSYVSSLIAKDLISIMIEAKADAAGKKPRLTSRQREVLQLIAEGRTMKEIASILHISQRTVETHKYDMMEDLGIQTTAALIQYALRLKLTEGDRAQNPTGEERANFKTRTSG
jgi:DNA-binding NarL/FixJ family response regulator